MKESRLIIIVSILLIIFVAPIAYLLNRYCFYYDWIGITTNLYCGFIVGLVTSICQYYTAKRKIINTIYSAYFDVYRTYYYAKENAFLWHYNSYNVYKKIIELGPKISESLDEYHGLFKKHDKTYKKLNPKMYLDNSFKKNNILKSCLLWFNKKYFQKSFSSLLSKIEEVLIGINEKRFEKDKAEMIRMYNYIYGENNKNK